MSVRKSKDQLLRVMGSELCNRCGTCVGLSGGAIEFEGREKGYRPRLRRELEPDQYDRIWNGCSGKYFDFPRYRKAFFKDTARFHPYTGPFESISIGYSLNDQLRREGASGGILSALLIYLLESGRISGAITTRMSPEKPWMTETFIATSREEILEGAQSKYIITSVNEILATSQDVNGDLAFVGLPGQVQSLRKLQASGDAAVRNIKYVFGPFYGNTLYFASVKSFLRSYGERDFRQIRKLDFRYGEWPGNMRIEMHSGRIIQLKKFHANYLIPFHIVRNSLYCTDFTNEFTDISGGDAWAPVYEERGKGFSVVIARTARGRELLEEMQEKGWLSLDEISEEECISMHSHGYDFKKRGAFIRIRLRRMTLRDVPDYGYTQKGFPLKRILMELVISGLFLVLGTRPARWMVERFSPAFIGKLFERTRTRWKRSTHHIKRESLGA